MKTIAIASFITLFLSGCAGSTIGVSRHSDEDANVLLAKQGFTNISLGSMAYSPNYSIGCNRATWFSGKNAIGVDVHGMVCTNDFSDLTTVYMQ